MNETKAKYGKGDSVKHKTYGVGTVVSVETVELPSDNDHTMYRVQMEDGEIRHFKASELSSKKAGE